MLRYGFFDSEITGYDEEGMPIFDRAESSDFLAKFISCIISNGVLALPGDCFQVLAHEGMELRVRPGFGVIKGRFAMDENEFAITVPDANADHMRKDRVVLRANYLQRKCEIVIKEGTPGADAVPPELLQPESGDYYELCLAVIDINPHQTVITQSSITDTRYDSGVCGAVTQVIGHLDTAVLFAQLERFYKEFVARSDDSYDRFVAAMDEYLDSLKKSGNSQIKEIVELMKAFETNAEKNFQDWLQYIKDRFGENVAGNLQIQIDKMSGKVDDYYQQSTGYTDQKIAELINGAPSTLDTLGEIAKAMQENHDVVEALETAIGTKASVAEFDSYKKEMEKTLGGFSFYPEKLTQAQYDALDNATKNAPKMLFIIKKG